MVQILMRGEVVLGVLSFVDGFVPVQRTRVMRIENEYEAMSHALYLQHAVSEEAALEFLERWLAGCRHFFTRDESS